jgi:hypothetical protein
MDQKYVEREDIGSKENANKCLSSVWLVTSVCFA